MLDINQNKIYGSLAGAIIGDALGWPQERIKKRIGNYSKNESKIPFIHWKRISGTRFNSFEQTFNPGEYSDDSQLILVTARSLLKGKYWSQYFAGYELPLWLMYERGGGKTLTEAANVWKRALPPWNEKSKFTKAYFDSGANGAAMRVLPHSLIPDLSLDEILNQVTLNSIITHGHPRAILGALLYSSAARYLITKLGKLEYGELIDYLLDTKDTWSKLRSWQSTYDQWYEAANNTNNRYLEIWEKTIIEIFEGLMLARRNLEDGAVASTKNLLTKLGAFNYESKGSGVVSSLAAIYAFSFYVNDPITGLVELAFLSNADTDTLASMTGGLFGAFLGTEWIHPEWEDFQDRSYVQKLAQQIYYHKIDDKLQDNGLLRWKETDSQKVIDQLLELKVNDSIIIGPFQSVTLIEKKELKSFVKKWKHYQWKLSTEIGQTIYITKQFKNDEQVFARKDVQLEDKNSATPSRDEVVETNVKPNVELLIRLVNFYPPYDFEVVFNNKNISLKVTDKDFIQRIEKGKVSFTKGDVILADLKVTVYKSGKNLYEVIKVIKNESGLHEPKFNFSE